MFGLILLVIVKFLLPTVITFQFLDRVGVEARASLTIAIIFGTLVAIFTSLFVPALIGV
jgi:hypothetical protein